MDNQSLRYILDDMLEDFQDKLVHKSTRLGHWHSYTDCSVRKAMGSKDLDWLEKELKVIGHEYGRFEGGAFEWSKYSYFSRVDIEPVHFLRIRADSYTLECVIQRCKWHLVRMPQESMDFCIYFADRLYLLDSQSLEHIRVDRQHKDLLDIRGIGMCKRRYGTGHSSHMGWDHMDRLWLVLLLCRNYFRDKRNASFSQKPLTRRNRLTAGESVTLITIQTSTRRYVILHSTLREIPTKSGTRILTFFSNTRLIASTLGMNCTFGSTTWRSANICWKTGTRRATIRISTLWMWPARRRIARISLYFCWIHWRWGGYVEENFVF